MKQTKNLALLMVMALLVIFSAACGGGETGAPAENTGEAENTENTEKKGNDKEEKEEATLSGTVAIDGSSTVFPIMEAVAEEYSKKNQEVTVSVNSSGSGGGFKVFTKGQTDLSNASRPIKEKEAAAAKENGIKYEEIELAFDGLTVAVSKKNNFVNQLTIEQLRKIFLADSGVTKWSQLNPEWPDEQILIYSPGHDSGTFDYFNETILEENPMREGDGVTLSEDDNTLVMGIKNSPYAIGYFGYAYYLENKNSLKALAIENKDGEFVKPTQETIQSKKYNPLSRPLFTYVNIDHLKEKPQVYDYVMFTLENAAKYAEAVGYVGLPEDQYQAKIEKLKQLAGK